LKAIDNFLGDAAQGGIVAGGAGQRQRDDGNVVDFDGLDDPAGHARRNDVGVLLNLVVELDQAPLAVFADVEADGDDALAGARHRVDVLDAVDLVEEFFQAGGDELFDLGGAAAREIDDDIGQGHDDLRLFLARRDQQRHRADCQGQEHQQQREVRVEELADYADGQWHILRSPVHEKSLPSRFISLGADGQ